MLSDAFDRDLLRLGRSDVLLLAATLVFLTAGGNAVAEQTEEVSVIGTVTVEGTVN